VRGAVSMAADDVDVDLAVALEPVRVPDFVAEEPEAVAEAEEEAVLGYNSALLYVVQELVAGILGSPPGAFWLSPRHTLNSLGL